MEERKINLEEILNKVLGVHKDFEILSGFEITKKDCINAMKKACMQTLELAAENAKEVFDDVQREYVVDKQSILDTINQVKIK